MEDAPKPFSLNNLEAFSIIISFLVLFFLLLIFAIIEYKDKKLTLYQAKNRNRQNKTRNIPRASTLFTVIGDPQNARFFRQKNSRRFARLKKPPGKRINAVSIFFKKISNYVCDRGGNNGL
jgi:hypothetical protein